MFSILICVFPVSGYVKCLVLSRSLPEMSFMFCFCFLVTPINQFLIIILGRCMTLYTPVCLQDEPTCMRIEPV